jgi:hypothetical protein
MMLQRIPIGIVGRRDDAGQQNQEKKLTHFFNVPLS